MGELKQIYKITNIKNGKIYIGQSNNPTSRFKQHMSKSSSSKNLSNDVEKYGKESFVLSIIEENPSDFKSREEYWIQKYKDDGLDLYNITKGGEEPPTLYGRENYFTLYSEKQLEDVIKLLSETNYNYNQIAKITNTSRDFAKRANEGTRTPINIKVKFPIRHETHFDKIARSIVYDLKNTKLTQKEISRKYGVARSMVTMINIGENRKNENETYPIRDCSVFSFDSKQKEEIIKKLREGKNPYAIAREYGIGKYQSILNMSRSLNSGDVK